MKMTAEQIRLSAVGKLNPEFSAGGVGELSSPISGTPRQPVSHKDERELQEQIANWCRQKDWIAFRSRMDRKTNRQNGEADFCCILPGSIVLFVECKTRDGELSEDQAKLFAAMLALGHTVHIIRSLEEFISLCGANLSVNGTAQSRSSGMSALSHSRSDV